MLLLFAGCQKISRKCASIMGNDAPDTVKLFNGRDLSGWEAEGGAKWVVQDGLLIGSHGDVVVSGDRAWWFYFGRGRRTQINVVELSVVNGKLVPGDPAQPTYIDLKPEREQEK